MKKNITVLYVEDDVEQRRDKMFVLSARYLKVMEANNCEEALSLYREHNFNLIITDIVMGENAMNGIEMAEDIRKTDKKIPILILTEYVSNTYLRQAVNLNNVYYVEKSELTSNLIFEEALKSTELHLGKNIQDSIQELSNNIYFDSLNGTIVRDGDVIHLTTNELKLLELFFQNKNQIVTFVTISFVVWEVSISEPIRVSIRSLVRSLRRKLKDDTELSIIITVQGAGYKLVIQ